MLFGLLSLLFMFFCLLIILLVLIQRGKGGLGMGYMGGGQQAIFGGSGGTDFFQKITWTLGAILVFGSLSLSLYRARQAHYGNITVAPAPAAQQAPSSEPLPQPQD